MSDPFAHCEALVREADKDRFLATLFASAKHRRSLFALYAFNVEVTRVRGAAHEPLPGEMRLQWWREVFAGAGHGEVRAHPVAAALLDTVVRYRLPPRAFVSLIDARAFDLYETPVVSLAELDDYAVSTASVLIELAALILNDGNDPGVRTLAAHLGIAQAIGGVLTLLPLHAARRQLYVPLELLQRHGADPEDIFAGKATPELRAALAELRLYARHNLAEAKALLASAPPAVLPALLPGALVQPLLRRMERRGYNPFKSVALSQWRKQWILWRTARGALPRAL